MSKSITVSEKVLFIKEYFSAHPGREPANIQRIYSDPTFNHQEVDILYAFLKMETMNSHHHESSIIVPVLDESGSVYPSDRSDEEMKVFFTAIQWIGTNVGSSLLEEIK